MERTLLRSARPTLGSDTQRTFNLFRRKGQPGLLCAVPEDCPVPRFVNAAVWEFAGTIRGTATVPASFNHRAAATGARFNGFYLFTDFVAPGRIAVALARGSGKHRTPASSPWTADPASLAGAAAAVCRGPR
jgi:hypothetical protein